MSRTRTSLAHGVQRFGRYMNGNLLDEVSYISDQFNGTYETYQCDDHSRWQTITDDPDTSNRGFKDVYHSKSTAIGLDLDHDFKLGYDSETPTFMCKPIGQSRRIWNLVPNATFDAPDWGSLIGSLADGLSGSVDTGCLALVTLKELGATIKMVRNPFNILKDDWRPLAALQSGYQLAKAGANIFLEGMYGWKSAYADVCNFAKAYGEIVKLSNVQTEYNPRLSFSQKVKMTWANDGIAYRHGTASDWAWRTASVRTPADKDRLDPMQKLKITGDRVYRIGCRQNMQLVHRLSKFHRIMNILGLDMGSLPATIWEAIPYSFVVDWFINWQALLGWSKQGRLMQDDVYNLGTSITTTMNVKTWEIFRCDKSMTQMVSGPWAGKTPSTSVGYPIIRGQTDWHIYERARGVPFMGTIIDKFINVNLNPSQLASGIALAVQRLVR